MPDLLTSPATYSEESDMMLAPYVTPIHINSSFVILRVISWIVFWSQTHIHEITRTGTKKAWAKSLVLPKSSLKPHD